MKKITLLLFAMLLTIAMTAGVALAKPPDFSHAGGNTAVDEAVTQSFDVAGPVKNRNGKTVGSFDGSVSDLHASFVKKDGKKFLMMAGHLEGTRTMNNGSTAQVDKDFAVPSKAIAACKILKLDIGAIHLDVLGLVVDLSPIHLLVTAVPGAGNLLGNLLCAVAGLLNPSSALATFINNLLAILALL